jgi:deoxyadenosine/deoxycytidine kinase
MKEIQDQLDAIFELLNDETQEAEDLLVVLQVEMGELEELLRKRGVVV